ncbi:hypothetical protein Q5H93_03575 [Hymenobacter sp. ASUV-10]|uniref:Uncharacterized protein n=1 Tax=Hymenobacter aranciens TaxID=3063996 RepID=A0ABT9B6A0_9BACT|nr:hypothetical protein [Hymenobacter sp. ASUV-10]MDO7873799.1 hypothetical protein [Hymenobacter sp. ASUV-10]
MASWYESEFISKGIWLAISGVLGYVSKSVVTHVKKIDPVKKMWNLKDVKKLTICMSASHRVNTGQHIKATTGVGQVKAFGYIIESIGSAYDITCQNVFLSDEDFKARMGDDLILLGGKKHNEKTRKFLEKIDKLGVVSCDSDDEISWKVEGSERVYIGETTGEKVVKDYGLIIRMKNPYSSFDASPASVCLFAGCHTYGTIAAAKYFTEEYIKQHSLLSKIHQSVFIIVECDVEEENPINIKVVAKHEF